MQKVLQYNFNTIPPTYLGLAKWEWERYPKVWMGIAFDMSVRYLVCCPFGSFWRFILPLVLLYSFHEQKHDFLWRLYYFLLSKNLSESFIASFYSWSAWWLKENELQHQVLPLTESILYKISVLRIQLSISLITTHPQPLIKGLKVKPLISVLKAWEKNAKRSHCTLQGIRSNESQTCTRQPGLM